MSVSGPDDKSADGKTDKAADDKLDKAADGKAAAGRAAAGKASELSGPERAELDELRAEVARLHEHPEPPRRRRPGWRGPVATLLIVVGCVLAPLSVVAVWTANQVSNTDRYVANITPLISEPAVQHALTDKITTEVTTRLNVKGLTGQVAGALSARGMPRVAALLNNFSGPLETAVNGFVHDQVAKIVTSPQFATLWVQLNRTAHAQLVKALSGQGNGAVSVSNGQVVLDLGPFIDVVKSRLSARGFTLVNKIPAIHPTLTLFSAKYLVRAQSGYRLLNALKWILPILMLVLLALGVYVARNHRRALVGAGLGFAGSMLALGAALAVARGLYLSSVPSSVPADAAAVLYDTLVRFIKDGLRVLFVIGLLVAAGAFFAGPSVTAVRTRGAFTSAFGWVRASGEHTGLSTGPVGRWTYRHRTALRVTAVIIAVLVFVFWSYPTWLVALLIAVVLLLVLGLIELIGRPSAGQVATDAG